MKKFLKKIILSSYSIVFLSVVIGFAPIYMLIDLSPTTTEQSKQDLSFITKYGRYR